MAAVDELVWDFQIDWELMGASKVQLIVNATNYDEPMRSDIQDIISYRFRSLLPICSRSIAPSWRSHVRLPHFVPQIHADHSRIIFVLLGQLLQAIEKIILGVLLVVPKTVSVAGRAAPLRDTGVIVQVDHQSFFCEDSDRLIEDL